MNKHVLVVGACNVDIGGRPTALLIPGDSNPGKISLSAGGVGRNIAHNLALLGADVQLITALGSDAFAAFLEKGLAELSINLEGSLRSQIEDTSTYLYVADQNGDMKIAVNDMGIYAALTPEFLSRSEEAIRSADAVVLDANLPAESIYYVAKTAQGPVLVDPVSGAKAPRLMAALPYISYLTPNLLEAEVLGNLEHETAKHDICGAAKSLLKAGVKNVIITLGEKGAYAVGQDSEGDVSPGDEAADDNSSDGNLSGTFLPAIQPESAIVSASGAGDALMAGLCAGVLEGRPLEECVRLGMAASAVTLECFSANNPELNWDEVKRRAEIN